MHMITPIYAAILGFLFVYLTIRTIGLRRRLKIGLGHEHPELYRAVRVHGNFVEYTPLALVLIFFVEQAELPQLLVHALGATLLVGRFMHAYGMSQNPEPFKFRVSGMLLTLTAIILSGVLLLYRAFIT